MTRSVQAPLAEPLEGGAAILGVESKLQQSEKVLGGPGALEALPATGKRPLRKAESEEREDRATRPVAGREERPKRNTSEQTSDSGRRKKHRKSIVGCVPHPCAERAVEGR